MEMESTVRWLIVLLFTILLGVSGWLIRNTLKKIMEAVEDMKKTLQEILQTLAVQKKENKDNEDEHKKLWDKYNEHEKRIDSIEDDVNRLNDIHEVCPQNPLKKKG